jgi:hypothetical protein
MNGPDTAPPVVTHLYLREESHQLATHSN